MSDLNTVVSVLTSINDELNYAKEYSSAKIILDELREIRKSLVDIEFAIKRLEP